MCFDQQGLIWYFFACKVWHIAYQPLMFRTHIWLKLSAFLTLFRLDFFGVPGPGRGASKAPSSLHKSESIDAIAMKLGG